MECICPAQCAIGQTWLILTHALNVLGLMLKSSLRWNATNVLGKLYVWAYSSSEAAFRQSH